MGKILYPVGTEVQIRDWYYKENLETSFTDQGNPQKRIVLEYNKGSEKPYVISTPDSEVQRCGRSFAVDEIKRYREVVDHLWGATAPAVDTDTNALTKDEVERLVAEAVSKAVGELEHRLSEIVLDSSLHAVNSAVQLAENIVHDHLLEEDQ